MSADVAARQGKTGKTSEGSRPAVKAGDAGMREVKTGEQRRASIGGQLRGAAGEGCT